MQEAPKHSWKDFLRLIFKSKLPWHLYILSFIALIASTTITLGLPKVMQRIFDGEIFDFSLVSQYFILMLGSIILIGISAFLHSITNPIAQRNIQYTIWPKLMRMPMRDYTKQPSLQLISRVTIDPGFIDNAVVEFQTMLNATFGLVGSFVIMYGMNAKLTFALLPIIPYILIVSLIVGHLTQKTQARVQTRFSALTAFFAERLPKIRLIKSFGKESSEIEEGAEVIQAQYGADKRRALVDLLAEPLMKSVQGIILGIVLIYGGILVDNGELKVSDIIAFYLYVQGIHMHVLKYGIFWQTTKEAKGASEKISNILRSNDEIMQRDESFDAARDQSNGDIILENVSFSYTDRNVLQDMNLTIPEGQVTAVVGPSGSGKSTVFSIIERMYEPNVGRVLVGDTPAEKVHLDDWRSSIAFVSQSTPLLSGTIRDNITYGIEREVSDDEVIEAAKWAAALEFIEDSPDGLDTEVGEFGSRLSGGQRQRVAIARAFIMNPDYLLLDEATSSLDASSESQVEEAISNLMKNRTTVMISHDLKYVRNADQIIVIDQGKVNGSGTHKELLKENELYKHLVDIQQQKDARLKLGFEH